jgi:hypothetical protein
VRPRLDDWTIVVPGQWNPNIFTQLWVETHILGAPSREFAQQYNLGPPFQGFRLRFGKITITPSPSRLIVGMMDTEEETVEQAEAVAVKTLEVLSHTPVSALGVNFGFLVAAPTENTVEAFSIRDEDRFAAMGATVTRHEIRRHLAVRGSSLFLRQRMLEDEVVHLHLNYNFDASSATEAKTHLAGSVMNLHAHALDLLREYAGLEVCEEDLTEIEGAGND